MAPSLSALLKIISDGVATIEVECASRNAKYPSLDDPLTPESIALQEALAQETLPIIAATYQLMATLMSPHSYYHKVVFGAQQAVALGVAEAGHVSEILRDVGPQGLHVSDIAKCNNLEQKKLGHSLRFLTSLHIFKEITPDRFVNNRVSSLLDSGKSVHDIVAHPELKYDGAKGFSDRTGAQADEWLKAAAFAVETVLDPQAGHSEDPADSALQRAFGTRLGLFSWYELPDNALRLRRFGHAMRSLHRSAPVLGGFDWSGLPPRSIVVDVGGGIGGLVLDVAKHFKHVLYICQDRPAVVDQAVTMWREQTPNQDVLDGVVSFQAHDFFQPQPVKNASVFVIRFTLHTMGDAACIEVLRHLRAAASPTTRLVIIDAVLSYNCPGDGAFAHIPGGEAPVAPPPLLPNLGIACADMTYLDVLLMSVTNTQERTLGEIHRLLDASGWRLEQVHRFPPPAIPQVVAIPA